MKHFWAFAEMAMDASLPFVVIWFVYTVFLQPELPNPAGLMLATFYLVFSFSHTNYTRIGTAGK